MEGIVLHKTLLTTRNNRLLKRISNISISLRYYFFVNIFDTREILKIIYLYLSFNQQVIAAEGEQKASRALKEAAEVIAQSPAALQLRYLQTLNTISAEKNSTIIFPLPIDFLSQFLPHRLQAASD